MIPSAIIDTGPLAAYYLPWDPHHAWAVAQFSSLEGTVFTCEAVITETCHFLRRGGVPAEKLLTKVAEGTIVLDFTLSVEVQRVSKLMLKYHDQPMSFADACLVCMAESTGLPVCTLDSDFHVYRTGRRKSMKVICP